MQEKSHKWVYITIIVVIVALMVAGAVLYRDQKETKEAQRQGEGVHHQAERRRAARRRARTTAVRLFGVDGGPYAQNPDEELLQSQYAWQLGTAGPASRPVILDPGLREGGRDLRLGLRPGQAGGVPGVRERAGDSKRPPTDDEEGTMPTDLPQTIKHLMPRLTDELKKLVRLPSVAFPDFPTAPVEQTGAAVAAAARRRPACPTCA